MGGLLEAISLFLICFIAAHFAIERVTQAVMRLGSNLAERPRSPAQKDAHISPASPAARQDFDQDHPGRTRVGLVTEEER